MKKNRINAYIERASDGTYNVYYTADLPIIVHGAGATVQEALDDFRSTFTELSQEVSTEQREQLELVEFHFVYDTASLLHYYSKYISLVGLAELTGIHRTQLSHYISGHRKPTTETVRKIEQGLHRLSAELRNITLL